MMTERVHQWSRRVRWRTSSKQDFFNEEPIKIQRICKTVTVGTENKEYFHNALFQDESKTNGELITRESESRCHRY